MRVRDLRKLLVIGVSTLVLTLVVQAASPKDAAIVKDVALNSSGQSLEARITSTEKARFTYFELDHPRRLVVDFHGLRNGVGFSQKKVAAAGVEQIRTSFFSTSERKATRIVFDLNIGVNYQVVDDGEGIVRVLFGDPKTPSNQIPAATQPPINLVAGPPVLAETREESATPVFSKAILVPPAPVQTPVSEPVLQVAPAPAQTPTAAAPIMAAAAIVQPRLVMPEATLQAPTVSVASVPLLTPIGGQISTLPLSTRSSITAPAQPQTFNGEIVTIDLKDTDIKDFLRLIGSISGLNVVVDPNVAANLNLLLTDVPWDQALDIVLRNNNLSGVIQGNVLRIATNATLKAEQDKLKAERDAEISAIQTISRTYILNYTKASDVKSTLDASGVLSAKGKIATEARRNAIIVSDVPAQFEMIEKMKSFIDVPAQQVEIEARLLTANKSFSREIGNQLGASFRLPNGNILTGGAGTTSPFNNVPLLANFGAGATSGLAFLLQPGGDMLLDEIITAAEARGTAKLMSRPKVTTQSNLSATIMQGTQIPVQTNVNQTIAVTFLPFTLKLDVTPRITEAGTILLSVDIENSQPDFARTVNGVPSVSTQQAKTQMLVADGSTMMIGGIYVDTDSLNIRQVPGLGSVPIIGNLFKNTQTIKSQAELLFFITPRIRAAEPVAVTTPGN